MKKLHECYQDYLTQYPLLKGMIKNVHIGKFNLQKYGFTTVTNTTNPKTSKYVSDNASKTIPQSFLHPPECVINNLILVFALNSLYIFPKT